MALSFLTSAATLPQQRTLIIGTTGKITHLDPHKTYWASDLAAYTQVVEGLFWTNLSDMEGLYPIVPLLAETYGTWDATDTIWTIPIRGNTTDPVSFTDGLKLNSSVVIWNYERIQSFMASGVSEWSVLAMVTNDTFVEVPGASAEYNATKNIFLFKSMKTAGEYAIQLELYKPDARVLGLLAFAGWSLISSDAHSKTAPTTFTLVGTGPFKLHSIESEGHRTFRRNDDYWLTPANIYEFKYIFVSDAVTLETGMLGGPGIRQYDMAGGGLVEYHDQHIADETTTFYGPVPTTIYYYAGFNTERIEVTHRKAMAYAYNYSYLIETWYEGKRDYMKSPVTPGIPYSKVDCDIPTFDVDAARAILIAAGDSGGLDADSTDAEWVALANTNPIATYNISHYTPSNTWEALATVIVDNMKHIGFMLTAYPMDDVALDLRMNNPENFPMVEIFIMGWGPDYLDPHNMIYDAFAGPDALNPMGLAGSTDPTIMQLIADLEEAMLVTDVPTRRDMYYAIQCTLMEDIVPWLMLMTRADFYVHSNEITNYPYNPFGDPYWYPVVWNPASASEVAIPGFDLIALFGAIGFATMLLLVRKYRK
jgi:ABC-type transport system substrate-binding protein